MEQKVGESSRSSALVEFLWPSVSTLVFLGTILSLLSSSFFHGLADDPGVGWHFKTGQIVYETGIVPHLDPFLGWTEHAYWVCDQWLGDYLFYSIYKFGGWPLVYGYVTAIFFLFYFSALLPYLRKFSVSTIGVPVGVYFACKLATIQLLARSTIYGIIFLGITLIFALHAKRDLLEHKKLFAKYVVGFSLLFLLWANVHPSFLLGIILLTVFLFSFLLDKLLGRGSFTDAMYCSWIGMILLCLLVTLVNPAGYSLHESIIALGKSDFFMNYHLEWKSVDFKEPAGDFLFVLFSIIGAGWFFGDGKKSTWQLLSVVVFGILALRTIRLVPHFAIVAILPCADALHSLWLGCISKLPIFSSLKDSIFIRAEKKSWFYSLGTSLLVLAFLVVPLVTGKLPVPVKEFGPSRDINPYAALAYLDEHEKTPVVVLNDPDWGGFMTFYSTVGHKPLFDDRNSVMGEARTKAWQKFYAYGDAPEAYIKSINPDYILLSGQVVGTKMLKAINKYPIVFEDSVATLFKVNK